MKTKTILPAVLTFTAINLLAGTGLGFGLAHAESTVLNEGRSEIAKDVRQAAKSQQKVDVLDDAY